MGYGSYRATDWAKLKSSRSISSTSSASDLFKSRSMDDRFNPRFIQVRESCDSADSPESTPIIIGFDVTGSMGYLAAEIAKNALNQTITYIYEKQPVTNPHVMCAAIGDTCDRAPLQVTQFEADIRIVEQLMDLWLEMRGGDFPEAYNLLWYFADRHTRTDAFEKRGQKGFLFTIGDATNQPSITFDAIAKIFDDKASTQTNEALLAAVSKKYEVFHIITKNTSSTVYDSWNQLLPGRVCMLDAASIGHLSEVITSIMQLSNGMDRAAVLAQWPETSRGIIERALSTIHCEKKAPAAPAAETAEKESFFSRLFHK